MIFLTLIMSGVFVFAQTSFIVPRNTDTVIYISSSHSYTVYDDGWYSNYLSSSNGSLTLVSTDGKPFMLYGNYSIRSGHWLTIYQGESKDYPIENFYSGSGNIKIFCYSGAVTLHFYSSSLGGTEAGFNLNICYPDVWNVSAHGTNSTYTNISWQGPSSHRYWLDYFQTNDPSRSTVTNPEGYSTSDSLAALASGTLYSYYIRNRHYPYSSTISDTGNSCIPEYHFRTPKVSDCHTCNHYRQCIDYTSLTGAKQVVCYKGNSIRPDSTECVVDNGWESATSRHTVNRVLNTYDPRTNNGLRLIPDGDTSSVRLGNWSSGNVSADDRGGESILYEIHVDTNDYDLMMLRYAVVFLQPANGRGNQLPRFSIRLYDENCIPVRPLCYSRDIIYNDTLTGWNSYNLGLGQNYKWHDWMAMGIDLSDYHGRTLYLQLYTRDGTTSGAAYAYFTLHCGRKQVDRLDQCGENYINTFYAPSGFSYRWYSASNPDSTLSTSDSLHVTQPGLYQCQVNALDCPDSTCGYIINALASSRYPRASFEYDVHAEHCQFNVRFVNRSYVVNNQGIPLWTHEDCETAFWDFGNGTTSTNYNAEAVYTQPGTYSITLITGIADNGCTDTLTQTITLEWEHPTPYITGENAICPGQEVTLTMHNSTQCTWYVGEEDLSADVLPEFYPESTCTVRCEVTDTNECQYTFYYQITVWPQYNENYYRQICQAQLPWTWRDIQFSTWTTSDTYTYYRSSIHGCDSVVNLHLTVLPSYEHNTTIRFCDYVTSYPYADSIYTTIGAHDYTFHLNTGCDSIVHLNIMEYIVSRDTIRAEVCRGYPFDTTGFHLTAEQTNTSGRITQTIRPQAWLVPCDSIVTLILDIRQPTSSTVSVTVNESNLPYIFNGVSFNHSVNDTVIHLSNRYGCDSSIHFTLFINQNTSETLTRTICQDELPYTWGTLTFNEAGTQYIVYPRSNGADSIVYHQLNVNPIYSEDLYDTICDNETFTFYGNNITTTGSYSHSMTTIAGCDSTETLHFTVHPTNSGNISADICDNQSYNFAGQELSSAGVYSHVFTNVHNCDSSITLVLNVLNVTYSTIYDTIVQNQLTNYTFNGHTYNSSIEHTIVTITNVAGCDSVIDFSLYVIPNVGSTEERAICQDELPIIWNGKTFNGPGTQTATLTSYLGSDSVVTMTLTVNPVYSFQTQVSICDNQTTVFNGNSYSSAGTYVDTLSSIHNCDSITTLILTVNPTYATSFADTSCDNQSYTFAGVVRNVAGSYVNTFSSMLGCDSVVTLNLTINPVTYGTQYDTIVENMLPHTYNGNTIGGGSFSNPAGGLFNDFDTTIVIYNQYNCDSVIGYHLHIHWNERTYVYDTICDNQLPYVWDGTQFAQSGTIIDTLTNLNGADSIVIRNLHVDATYNHIFQQTICDNQSYTFADSVYTLTGIYTHNLISHEGCDSTVTLQLTVNAVTSGTVTEYVIENNLPHLYEGCSFGSSLFTSPMGGRTDTYDTTITITNVNNCDSIIAYTLNVYWNVYDTIFDTICHSSLPFIWNNRTFLSTDYDSQLLTGNASKLDTLLATTGADSILTMNLHVNPTYDIHYYDTICSDATSSFNGIDYDLPGNYLHSLSSIDNCDSLETLHLTVFGTSAAVISDTIVENNLPHTFADRQFTQSLFTPSTYLTPRFSSLDSVIVIQNSLGCDSTIHYTLSVHWNVSADDYDTLCENLLPHIWNHRIFYASDYNLTQNLCDVAKLDTLTAYTGADSILTMHLTVDSNSHGVVTDTIVENQLPHSYEGCTFGISYFTLPTGDKSNFYDTTIVITNTRGCDSIVSYRLWVWWNPTTDLDSTICENSLPFTWQGVTFTSQTQYHTIQYFTDTVIYSAIHGEDSLVVLHLTVNPNTYSTLFDTIVENDLPYSWNGIAFVWDDTVATDMRHAELQHSNTLVNHDGCDSVADMNLYVWRNVTAIADSNVCENFFPITWNSITFDTTGSADVMLQTTHGADSLLTMNVTQIFNSTSIYWDTIVEDMLPYLFNGYSFELGHFPDTAMWSSDSSVYWQHFSFIDSTVIIANHLLCDSIISYRLHVHWNVHSFTDSTVCSEVLPLQWNHRVFTDSIANASPLDGRHHITTLFDTLPAFNGADSIITMQLRVMPSYTTQLHDTVCDGQEFIFYGDTLTVTGEYAMHFTTTDGCDSSEYLYFANFPNYNLEYYDTICDYSGVMRLGVEYIGVAHLNSIHLCDSNETYHLWGLPVSYSNVDTIISDHLLPFNYNGHIFSDTSNAQMQLILTNQYGCDSIINFTLTVMPTERITLDSTICEGLLPLTWDSTIFIRDSVQFVDSGFQNTIIIDTFHTRYGADSIVTRRLHVNPEYNITYIDTTCNGAPYSFGDSNYNVSGTYVHNYMTLNGCDSVETLHLQVNAMSYATVHDTIVQNQLPYQFGGVTFYDTTDIVDSVITILNTAYCDSVITYSLHIIPNHYNQHDTSLCDNQLPFVWDGLTISSAGIDSIVVLMPDGSDSITYYVTTVYPTYHFTDTLVTCDSIQWHDSYYYNTTSPSDPPVFATTSVVGCDSVISLNLTVHYSAKTIDSVFSCEPYLWIDSNTYTESTSGVNYMMHTIKQCDSIIVLELIVSSIKSSVINDTICQGVSYQFGDELYTRSGSYSLTLPSFDGCDSIITLNLEVLQPPLVSIDDSDYDCETGIYTLHVNTEAPYIYWTSYPDDPALIGHEQSRSLRVSPRTHELYMLFVDYKDVPTCPNKDSIYISPLLKPHADIEYTPEFLTYDQLHLSAINRSTNEERHRWYINGDDFGDAGRISYNADPTELDSVLLELVAVYGRCQDTAIRVIPVRKATIWAPNAFTPGESSNNHFYVRYMGITDYHIDLYTRGGALVWHSDNMEDFWDGTYQGKDCPQGTYVWIIRYRDVTAPQNKLSKKGTVTLIR